MSKKVKVTLVVSGAVVLVAGIAAAKFARNRKATQVLTAKVEEQDVVAKVTANGKIQAENKVELSALVQGLPTAASPRTAASSPCRNRTPPC